MDSALMATRMAYLFLLSDTLRIRLFYGTRLSLAIGSSISDSHSKRTPAECMNNPIRPTFYRLSALFLGALLFWLPSLQHSYFLSDDFVHLVDWGLPSLSEVLTWFYREYAGFYRPLTALWWKGQFTLWGMNAIGYQLSNLILHIACALLVGDIASRLGTKESCSPVLATLVFLILPGHMFGVMMISANTGLLCSVFYLLSVATYLRHSTALSLTCFVCALLTKELALSLPIVISTWDFLRRWSNNTPFQFRAWLWATIPYAAISVLYVGSRYAFFGHLPSSPLHDAFTLLRLIINAATYSVQMIIPWGIDGLKPFFRSHPQVLLACAILGLSTLMYALWISRSTLQIYHVMAITWICASILPVVRLYSPWNVYLPMVGIALLWSTCKVTRPHVWQSGALILLLGLSTLYSMQQQYHWSCARELNHQVVSSAVDHMRSNPGTLYLANLPAEWSGAPLLVDDWVLQKAVRLYGIHTSVIALSNVIQFQRHEPIQIEFTGDSQFDIQLLTPPSFFRIEQLDVLSHAVDPQPGYTYTKSNAALEVLASQGQGQPNSLRVTVPATLISQTVLWNGSKLVPLKD